MQRAPICLGTLFIGSVFQRLFERLPGYHYVYYKWRAPVAERARIETDEERSKGNGKGRPGAMSRDEIESGYAYVKEDSTFG